MIEIDDGDWRVWNEKFGENFDILLPMELREKVSYHTEVHGQKVRWYFTSERGIGIVSDSGLEKNKYISMGSSKIHDDGNVVPTKNLRENFSKPIYEGLRAAFVANSDMLTGEKKSAYLITESHENDLLQNRDGAEGLRDIINTTPEFFASPY
jgi:hypothetical protein